MNTSEEKSHRSFTWRELRSTIQRCVILTLLAYSLIFIFMAWQLDWHWISAALKAAYYLFVIVLVFITLIWQANYSDRLQYEKAQQLFRSHICPHCQYSLIGLSEDTHGLTKCPECGISWKFSDDVNDNGSKKIKYYSRFPLPTILLIVIGELIWSTFVGMPVFSSINLLIISTPLFFIIIAMFFPSDSRYQLTLLSINKLSKLVPGRCPACKARINNKQTDTADINTCPVCGAAWKLPDRVAQP